MRPAIRRANWKLELCSDPGGWSEPRPGKGDASKLPPVQLYDLALDKEERKNVAADHPAEVEQLARLLQSFVDRGRSTPGAPQKNDVAVMIRKGR